MAASELLLVPWSGRRVAQEGRERNTVVDLLLRSYGRESDPKLVEKKERWETNGRFLAVLRE